MPLYSYVAHDHDGKESRGTIDALSMQAARESLQALHLEADELYELPSVGPSMSAPVSPAWSVNDERPAPGSARRGYFPLTDTLRLYSGWLLAWYALIFAFGSYQYLRKTSVEVLYLEELFLSPLVLSFAWGAFLFLLLSSLHRLFGRSVVVGIGLAFLGIVLFVAFRANT
jgi:hypothetical protein